MESDRANSTLKKGTENRTLNLFTKHEFAKFFSRIPEHNFFFAKALLIASFELGTYYCESSAIMDVDPLIFP